MKQILLILSATLLIIPSCKSVAPYGKESIYWQQQQDILINEEIFNLN